MGNLAVLEQSDLFDTVALYNRAGACLFEKRCPSPDAAASILLSDVLFDTWTEEERSHYEDLQKHLAALCQK